jgi:putative ABC transport system substrate-binding protein
MDRRAFLAGAAALLAAPLAAEGQPAGKVPRIGFLGLFSPELAVRSVAAVREGLAELGWREGQNIHFEQRVASGRSDHLLPLAVELIEQKVDVIVAFGTDASLAAKGATSTIPVVMGGVGDAVGTGLVTSLARPGGNVTGMSLLMTDLIGKQLQLLKEVAPRASRIGVISLGGGGRLAPLQQMQEYEAAAQQYGVELLPIVLRDPLTLDDLASQLRTARVDAVLGRSNPALDDVRVRIVEVVNARRLPSVFSLTYWAEAGGLMSYSANLYAVQRRAATFVDKILRGAKPADLPVEQPTKLELVINLKTAKALGLTIPPSLLQRADQVIE